MPEGIEKKLLKLVAYFGLNYVAIDTIVTVSYPDGRHVFLEINPVGEFFWLECCSPNFPISEAIADVLLTKSCTPLYAGGTSSAMFLKGTATRSRSVPPAYRIYIQARTIIHTALLSKNN